MIKVEGRKISNIIKEELKEKVSTLSFTPVLSIIYVGQHPAIDQFVGIKKRFGEAVGVDARVHRYPEDISEEDLIKEVNHIEKDSHGMIIQLPLPIHIKKENITSLVPPQKDVDVLSAVAFSEFSLGKSNFTPPVPGAIQEILNFYKETLENKKVAVIGYGSLVGLPIEKWLNLKNITPEIFTRDNWNDKKDSLKDFDVIISGTGSPDLITQDLVKEGVLLFDAGTSEAGGVLKGDIHPDCYNKASLFTPVPGGIGPLTVAVLFKNLMVTL